MRRIVAIVLGLAVAVAVGGLLLGTGRAAATSHLTFDSPDPPDDLYWTAGIVNTTLQLSSVSGGTGRLVYSLELSDGSPLPRGFVFNSSSQQLSSTTDVVAGSHTLRYTVADSTSSVHQDFDVTVNEAVSLVSVPAGLRWSAEN